MVTELNLYSEQADVFLKQAMEELEKDDLRQAAEKGWGAAAQMIKAVAEQRGWPHRSHRHIVEAASRLSEESGDASIASCFGSARSLHVSFYEGDLSAHLISRHLQDVSTFIRSLRRIQNGA